MNALTRNLLLNGPTDKQLEILEKWVSAWNAFPGFPLEPVNGASKNSELSEGDIVRLNSGLCGVIIESDAIPEIWIFVPISPLNAVGNDREMMADDGKVFCGWAAQPVRATWLKGATFVSTLTKYQVADVLDLVRYSRFTCPAPKDIEHRIGLPIVHASDPRIQYQAMMLEQIEEDFTDLA